MLTKLTQLITIQDFNIASDAYETFQEIFIVDRGATDLAFADFMAANREGVLCLFDFLAADSNYFAKREGLKLLYQLLCKHAELREVYTESKERLKFVMNTVLDQNKAIQYEAFLLLSLFILVEPTEGSGTQPILLKNKKMLFDFIGTFQNDKEEADFYTLKNAMREILQNMGSL